MGWWWVPLSGLGIYLTIATLGYTFARRWWKGYFIKVPSWWLGWWRWITFRYWVTGRLLWKPDAYKYREGE